MELTYQISDETSCRVNELLIRPIRKVEYYYFRLTMPLIAILAAVVIIAVSSDLYLFAIWIIAMAISFLVRVKSHRKFHQSHFYPANLDKTFHRVQLSLLPEGIKGIIQDVVSFAPWSAVRDQTLLENFLIVNLKTSQRIIIPRTSPESPQLDLEAIRDELVRSMENPPKTGPNQAEASLP